VKLRAALLGRSESRFSLADLLSGSSYYGGYAGLTTTMDGQRAEVIPNDFVGYVHSAYRGNGIVYAAIAARARLLSEARFAWQALDNGRPGDLFSTAGLDVLNQPWPNGSAGELWTRMEQDASIAGNAFIELRDGRLWRLRPDWVQIVLAGESVDEIVEGGA